MRRKVIIDADPGVGSALAILAAMNDPEVDLLAVTATAGRVSAVQAASNIQALVNAFDPAKRPRIGWSTHRSQAAIEVPNTPCSPLLNGKHGLGGYEAETPLPHHRMESAKLLIDLVKEHPNEITLLTLGPLSNIARAADLNPDVLQHLHEIVVLGGTYQASGDVTPAAEFNFYADPAGAKLALNALATKTLVPLDISEKVDLSYEQYNDWFDHSTDPIGQLLQEMMPYAFRAHHQLLGRESLPLREMVGLAVAVRPLTADSEQIAVDIECEGSLTRGAAVFDEREHPLWNPNVELVTTLDSQGVLDYCRTMMVRKSQ